MTTPPTRVGRFQSASGFNTTGTPQTQTLNDLQVGDLVTLFVGAAHNDAPEFAFTPTAPGIVFTVRGPQIAGTGADRSCVFSWTGAVTVAGSPVLTVTKNAGGAYAWGFEATVWRNHGGVGDYDSAFNAGPAAPQVTLTTLADSAVLCLIADWDEGAIAGRVWRTLNGITPTAANTKETLAQGGAPYGLYSAYWDDVAAEASVVGMTAPNQHYSIVAIEVLAVPDPPPSSGSVTDTLMGSLGGTGTLRDKQMAAHVTAGRTTGSYMDRCIAAGSVPFPR